MITTTCSILLIPEPATAAAGLPRSGAVLPVARSYRSRVPRECYGRRDRAEGDQQPGEQPAAQG